MPLPFSLHPRAVAILAVAILAVAALVSPAAVAAPVTLDLPAQPLAESLKQLSRAAGLTLMADAALLAGRQAPAVRGTMEPGQVLQRLLADSGLAGTASEGVLVIAAATAATPVARLATVDVVAAFGAGSLHAGTRDVVTRAELDRFPPTSTSDIFRDVPGVVAVNGRNGVSFDLNIRGMQSDRVKVLVDGTQATSNTSKSYGGEGNHNYVDPDLVGSIVVEKGPNTGPYGAGTGGGVVHLNTLGADDLLRDGKNWGLRMRGGWASHSSPGQGYMNYQGTGPLDLRTPGSNGSGSLAGAWRGLDGKLDLVAAYSRRRTSNYYAGERGPATYAVQTPNGEERRALSRYLPGQEVFNTSQDTRSTLFKARLVLPREQWAELSHSHLHTDFGEARLTAFDYNIEQKPLAQVRKSTSLIRYGWQPSDRPFWNLRVNVWHTELDELHPEVTYGVSGTTRTDGLEAWNTSAFKWGGNGWSVAYGGSIQHERTTGLGVTEPRGKRTFSSLFARADASLTEWLTLDAGLRRETYTTDGTGSFISSVPGQSRIPFDVSDGHSRVNPAIGVTVAPWPSTELYARYSQGWRPPTAKEVGLSYGNARSVLRPEVTKSAELGARFAAADLLARQDRLSVKLAWFNNRHDNYLARSLGMNGNTPYYYFNIDGARFRGVELDVRYDSGRFFASYGLTRYSRAQFCGFVEPACTDTFDSGFGIALFGLALPPRQTQSLTLGTRLLERRLTLGLRAQFVGAAAGRLAGSNGEASLGWEPYEVYDLFGSFRVNRQLDIGFSLENLRDRYYVPAMSSPSIAIPSPGRTAKVTLTYQF